MTINEKKELIAKIVTMLDQLIPADEKSKKSDFSENSNPVEMLTIKECAESIKGLSEHTVRQLVAQKKIPFIRTGQGRRGKILISRQSLLNYLSMPPDYQNEKI